jgi:hypothetical protein
LRRSHRFDPEISRRAIGQSTSGLRAHPSNTPTRSRAPAAPRPIAAADEDEDLDDSPLMPLPPALPFDMPPPPPKPADAALRNAVGLAWTALLLAVIIPPVGIVLGWYCISVTRETVVQDSVGIANQVKLVSYASMVVGCLATLGVISMLF